MRTSSYGKNKKPEKQKPQGVKKSVRYEMAPFYTEIETLQHTEGTALPETLWAKLNLLVFLQRPFLFIRTIFMG